MECHYYLLLLIIIIVLSSSFTVWIPNFIARRGLFVSEDRIKRNMFSVLSYPTNIHIYKVGPSFSKASIWITCRPRDSTYCFASVYPHSVRSTTVLPECIHILYDPAIILTPFFNVIIRLQNTLTTSYAIFVNLYRHALPYFSTRLGEWKDTVRVACSAHVASSQLYSIKYEAYVALLLVLQNVRIFISRVLPSFFLLLVDTSRSSGFP